MPPSIHEVASRHAEALMALPGVVSVGIGAGEHGSAAIVVGLVREERETLRALPKRLEGFEVRAEIVGPYRAR